MFLETTQSYSFRNDLRNTVAGIAKGHKVMFVYGGGSVKRNGCHEDIVRTLTDAVIRLLTPYKKFVNTITTDNGVEFMEHKRICKALDCVVYFADPYCSGQKGGVENINKIFREYFPKGTDFRHVDQKELNRVQYQINDRPRKKLGFSTPKIEFFKRIR